MKTEDDEFIDIIEEEQEAMKMEDKINLRATAGSWWLEDKNVE